MAFVTKAESDLHVHEFFDRIKKRAIDWIASGNELWTSDNRFGDELVELRFVKATPPPPKTYTFAEAYAMMKQGKWMKPDAGAFAMRQVGKDWFLFDPVSKRALYRGEPADRAEFLDTHIESQWTEVVI